MPAHDGTSNEAWDEQGIVMSPYAYTVSPNSKIALKLTYKKYEIWREKRKKSWKVNRWNPLGRSLYTVTFNSSFGSDGAERIALFKVGAKKKKAIRLCKKYIDSLNDHPTPTGSPEATLVVWPEDGDDGDKVLWVADSWTIAEDTYSGFFLYTPSENSAVGIQIVWRGFQDSPEDATLVAVVEDGATLWDNLRNAKEWIDSFNGEEGAADINLGDWEGGDGETYQLVNVVSKGKIDIYFGGLLQNSITYSERTRTAAEALEVAQFWVEELKLPPQEELKTTTPATTEATTLLLSELSEIPIITIIGKWLSLSLVLSLSFVLAWSLTRLVLEEMETNQGVVG